MTAATEKIRVLVVDDNEGDYTYAQALLDEATDPGYEVSWAAEYQAAFDIILKSGHDIFLLDHRLGAATGIDLLRAARQAGVTTPVIMLTGLTDGELDRAAMKEGASDFLVKGELSSALLERSIRYAVKHHRLLREMENAAKHDTLTGLANRRQFRAFLNGAIARAERSKHILGVLFVDLDHFKEVNDQLGHDAGDEVLIAVARVLTRCVRQGDLVARLGGDEFAIVLDNIGHSENAARVAQKVIDTLHSHLLDLGTGSLGIGASIGVAAWPNDSDDVDGIIKAADTAMYQAKLHGRNNYQCFESRMQVQAMRRAKLKHALESAISKGELTVYYQTQVVRTGNNITGLEALLRWTHCHESITPSEFIPIAEENGLIDELGEWVLMTACRQFREWELQGLLPSDLTLAVNVSARQMTRGGLLAMVERILVQSGIDPTRLEFEITESAALTEKEHVAVELNELRRRGVRIALDDFGTGHSSLSYLLKLPIQTIKIDRSFVQSCVESKEGAALVKGTLGLAHSLGLRVVAEGVETEAQCQFLLENGCMIMQGFLFHRPAPAAAVEKTLREAIKV